MNNQNELGNSQTYFRSFIAKCSMMNDRYDGKTVLVEQNKMGCTVVKQGQR